MATAHVGDIPAMQVIDLHDILTSCLATGWKKSQSLPSRMTLPSSTSAYLLNHFAGLSN